MSSTAPVIGTSRIKLPEEDLKKKDKQKYSRMFSGWHLKSTMIQNNFLKDTYFIIPLNH